jgi:hypothetical protein
LVQIPVVLAVLGQSPLIGVAAGTMASPTPPPGGPNPLTLGKHFVKQYYHVLMTNPEDIVKFYAETAVFSHGEGSQPTTPTNIGPEKATLLKDRLFSSRSLTVDLAEGAIDAQVSCGGGVLVVVTGHMIEDNNRGRRAFCHTFFLNVVPDSKKKHYYVYNDLFRFLSEEDTKEEVQVEEPEAQEEPVPVEKPAVVVEEPEVVVEEAEKAPEPVLEEEPIVVEESIVVEEEPPMYAPALEPEPAVEETKEEVVKEVKPRRKSKSRSGRKKSLSPTAAESLKPAPGSWASLVAKTSSAPVSVSPTRRTVVEKKEAPVKEDVKPEHGKRVQKRDPENTIVIKNMPEGTKEAEVRELFEPFAKETNGKIVVVNVSAKSNLAFVDFDSSAPVLLALQEKHRLQLNGRTLDIEQKVIDRAKRASRQQRSSQVEKEKDANGFKRSNQQKSRRHSGGGRAERGGGGRGGRGER